MKRENLEKSQDLIDQALKIEYVIGRINNFATDSLDNKWDWQPAYLNRDYAKLIIRRLTAEEEDCLQALKDAMTAIFKKAAERALKEINNEIESM